MAGEKISVKKGNVVDLMFIPSEENEKEFELASNRIKLSDLGVGFDINAELFIGENGLVVRIIKGLNFAFLSIVKENECRIDIDPTGTATFGKDWKSIILGELSCATGPAVRITREEITK